MPFQLLYIAEGEKFPYGVIEESLLRLSNVRRLATPDDCKAAFRFESGSDFTTIRFKHDMETIAIGGAGQASLEAAVQIQAACEHDVHLIDEGYTYDLIIRESASPSDLDRRIRNASC